MPSTKLPSSLIPLVPSSRWGSKWNTARTVNGFKNSNGVTCYRNAALQMLFHLPVFLNWVETVAEVHVNSEGLCQNGAGPDETDDDDKRCKVCLIHDLLDVFWNAKAGKDDLELALDDFWDAVFDDWIAEKPEDSTGDDGQQDVAEFITELLKQLSVENIADTAKESLDDMFAVESADKRTCAGVKGCGAETSNPSSFDFLAAHFSEDEDSQTLEEAIENTFATEPIEAMCTACKKDPVESELVLTEVPEVLLVQLNRIDQQVTESGEAEPVRIESEIQFSEELVLRKEWLDPKLGDIRKDIKYVLSSVLLHQGPSMDAGHYMAAVKSQDGTWTLADDTKLSTYESFEALAGSKDIRKNAYVFAYRRLPLVTRGPGISLKESLLKTKYSDAGAGPAETYDKMDIDKKTDGGAAETSDPMDFYVSPPDAVMRDVSLPNGPQVTQKYNEDEIELDEKQRGTLEIKFTTNTGRTTLKAYVKGFLWNELKETSRKRTVQSSTRANCKKLVKDKKLKLAESTPNSRITKASTNRKKTARK